MKQWVVHCVMVSLYIGFSMVVGVDLIEIARVERVLGRYGDRFLERVFTPAEVLYSRGRVPELAARFAAKEAVSKALGVGMRMISHDGISWRDVEVVNDMRGKPLVRLYGRAVERAKALGLTEWEISLSHTRDMAIAFVVAQ
jgi:holo-[acyl-carrier protein] synthase